MTDEAAVDERHEESASLPRRSDALRCPHTELDDRRCVLPPEHESDHVYPHQQAAVLCVAD